MPEITGYAPGTPCWVDVSSPDIPASRAFYQALFGWDAEDKGPESGDYTVFSLDGLDVAGLGPNPEPTVMPFWTVHLAVADTDATVAQVQAAGGAVFVPPFDVLDEGRMAIVADTAGAVFGVWQAAGRLGAQVVHEPNTFSWAELTVRDLDAALPFYESVFGLTAVDPAHDMDDQTFKELQRDGKTVAGAVRMTDDWPPEIPSHWMPYFAVADVDLTAAKASELGGNVNIPPQDVPTGRFAVLSDSVGAHFCIIKLKPGIRT